MLGLQTHFSKRDEEYPQWFAEGKTSLLPKPGDFSSENQRPITSLNNLYKWFTSCVQGSMDSHLDDHELMENGQRGAKAGSSGTTDNLLIDEMYKLDCHRNKRNLSMAWVDVKKRPTILSITTGQMRSWHFIGSPHGSVERLGT